MSTATAPERDLAHLGRLVTKFVVNGTTPAHRPDLGACWDCTAGVDSDGYGRFKLNGRACSAHRVIYELAHGPIPEGVIVDHKCHNHACVRQAHLRPVTVKGNAEHRMGPNVTPNRSSKYRGVTWHRRIRAWQAAAKHNGRSHHAGYHSTPEAAAKAAQALRIRLFDLSDMDRVPSRENGAQALAGGNP